MDEGIDPASLRVIDDDNDVDEDLVTDVAGSRDGNGPLGPASDPNDPPTATNERYEALEVVVEDVPMGEVVIEDFHLTVHHVPDFAVAGGGSNGHAGALNAASPGSDGTFFLSVCVCLLVAVYVFPFMCCCCWWPRADRRGRVTGARTHRGGRTKARSDVGCIADALDDATAALGAAPARVTTRQLLGVLGDLLDAAHLLRDVVRRECQVRDHNHNPDDDDHCGHDDGPTESALKEYKNLARRLDEVAVEVAEAVEPAVLTERDGHPRAVDVDDNLVRCDVLDRADAIRGVAAAIKAVLEASRSLTDAFFAEEALTALVVAMHRGETFAVRDALAACREHGVSAGVETYQMGCAYLQEMYEREDREEEARCRDRVQREQQSVMQSVQPVLQLSNKSGSVGNSPYASPARSHRTLLDDHVGGGSSSGRSDAANASAPDGPTAAADVVGSSVSDAALPDPACVSELVCTGDISAADVAGGAAPDNVVLALSLLEVSRIERAATQALTDRLRERREQRQRREEEARREARQDRQRRQHQRRALRKALETDEVLRKGSDCLAETRGDARRAHATKILWGVKMGQRRVETYLFLVLGAAAVVVYYLAVVDVPLRALAAGAGLVTARRSSTSSSSSSSSSSMAAVDIPMLLLHQWRVLCERLARYEARSCGSATPWPGPGPGPGPPLNSSHPHLEIDVGTGAGAAAQLWVSYLGSRVLWYWVFAAKTWGGGDAAWAASDAAFCTVRLCGRLAAPLGTSYLIRALGFQTLARWLLAGGAYLSLQDPLWTLLGPAWPLGALLATHAMASFWVRFHDATAAWPVVWAPHALLRPSLPLPRPGRPAALAALRRRYQRALDGVVDTRPWLVRAVYPILCLAAAVTLGTHYRQFHRRSFVYAAGFHPLSVASWRRVGVTWDDVHALVLQLAHCAGTVVRDVAAEMHDLWSQL